MPNSDLFMYPIPEILNLKDISLRYLLSSYLAVFIIILVIVIGFPFLMSVKNIMKIRIKKYVDHYSLINKGRFMPIYNLNEYFEITFKL